MVEMIDMGVLSDPIFASLDPLVIEGCLAKAKTTEELTSQLTLALLRQIKSHNDGKLTEKIANTSKDIIESDTNNITS